MTVGVEGAKVEIYKAGVLVAWGYTDEEGKFSTKLTPGFYEIKIIWNRREIVKTELLTQDTELVVNLPIERMRVIEPFLRRPMIFRVQHEPLKSKAILSPDFLFSTKTISPTLVSPEVLISREVIAPPVPVLRWAYVGGNVADSFVVIDIEDPTLLTQVGAISGVTQLDGAWGIDEIDPDTAVAMSYPQDYLNTVDVTDKTAPSLIASLLTAEIDAPTVVFVKNY